MVDEGATRPSSPERSARGAGFFLPRPRGEFRCRYCLEEFVTEEEAVDYCMYAPHGRHENEGRTPRQRIGYPWKPRCKDEPICKESASEAAREIR
jgi:hypothetical protein